MNTQIVPTEAISLYNHALELTNSGKLVPALDEYKKAIKIYPQFLEAYNNIGELYSQMGNKEDAISTYIEALKISKNSRTLLNIGVEYYSRKNHTKALEYFNDSITLEPEFLEGNLYAALVNFNLKNYDKAQSHLELVVRLDQKHYRANYLLSYLYYEKAEYQSTINCLDNIKDSTEDVSFINKYYGFCYFHLSDYKKAGKYLTKALKSKPQYKKFKKYLNNLTVENKMKEIGDIEHAISDLESKMKSDDVIVADISKLSMLYIFQGNNAKAEKLLVNYKNIIAS